MTDINTTSTFASLSAASCTSCSIQKDLSAYWTPLLYYQFANGSFINVPNDGTVVYYLGRGEDRQNIVPFPPGFRLLSGDSTARSYDNSTMTYGNKTYTSRPVADRVSFACIDYNHATPETSFLNNTNCPNGLRAQIQFQSCWDGVNLYKSDQSHVAYMSQIDNGVCPPSHPKLLPHLFFEIYYFPNTLDTSDGGRFVFSNGDTTGYGFHGGTYDPNQSMGKLMFSTTDFMNGWDNDVLTAAVAQCINGNPSGVIESCPPLEASQDEYFTTNCPERPALVNEQVKGVLPKLPGCNNVTSGPAAAPQGICATQPSLNSVANTDGQTRPVPVINTTVVTLSPGNTAQYKGCYVEASNARALSATSYTNTTGMSTAACGRYCLSQGFSVFGTEYSQECYCGNSISTAPTNQTDCAMVCSGNSSEYCGGPNRLSVWSITASAGTGTSTTTTTGSSTSATPSVSGASYVSCYADNTGVRTLSSRTTDPNMTLELCAQTARSSNVQYFGLEYAGECWSGNTLASTAGPLAETKCNKACKGNANELCGGPNALSLFQNTFFVQPRNLPVVNVTAAQNAQYTYQGCFTEGQGGRSLGSSSSGSTNPSYSTTNANMTVELCVAACYGKGFSYAGVEYARECYCNNAGIVNAGGPAPGGDADCSMICAGSQGEYCGGPNRLNVYKLGDSAAAGTGAGTSVRKRHVHGHARGRFHFHSL